MQKTSVYLSALERELLRRMAEQRGSSQAEVIRAAVRAYAEAHVGERGRPAFALFESGEGDGTSVADIDERDLLEGFGG